MLEQVREQVRERIEAELAKQLREIPQTVKRIVESAILSILGIHRDSRGYFVDAFGGNNPLNSYIQEKVDQSMGSYVAPLVNKELARILKFKTLPRDIGRKVAQNSEWKFERAVKERLEKKFDELAERYAERVEQEFEEITERIEQEFEKILAGIADINEDIYDPNSYKGLLGEVLLEERARILAESSE